ncbi:glycoside hydrolase family 16 protein [Sphingomonadaceae bacterium OTU29LAMAA1]|nr:glycoside hydrolase family 16 protein [Sphingomonadaceae bacterium OTU29LAMAA1]
MLLFALAAQLAQPAPQTLGASDHHVDVPMTQPAVRPSFADEFDGVRVDRSQWTFDRSRNAAGWYNHERQYYGPDNARVAGGSLVIEARKETLSRARAADWSGQSYTSAKLVSRKAFGYGFYAIRARLPCGRGTWPAIWLLPSSGVWPAAGEIDIMEMVGWDPNVVHATLHSEAYNHAKGTQRGAQVRVSTACTAFHTYQLDWRRDAILIGVDGRGYMRVVNDRPGGTAAWPFNRPYQLILNLAVGGDWGGAEGIDDAVLPQRMSVDYVRYWASATP